jgi:hypothetical protein
MQDRVCEYGEDDHDAEGDDFFIAANRHFRRHTRFVVSPHAGLVQQPAACGEACRKRRGRALDVAHFSPQHGFMELPNKWEAAEVD